MGVLAGSEALPRQTRQSQHPEKRLCRVFIDLVEAENLKSKNLADEYPAFMPAINKTLRARQYEIVLLVRRNPNRSLVWLPNWRSKKRMLNQLDNLGSKFFGAVTDLS